MKKKIGEIYNKPIVIGDKNLMTKNEVHKDEISGGSKEYDDLNTLNLLKEIFGLKHTILL